MVYRKDYRAPIRMVRWKRVSLVAVGVLLVGVGCLLGIPRTTPYRAHKFEAFQVQVADQPWALPDSVPGLMGSLAASLTPEQVRTAFRRGSIAFEELTPQQQALFLEVPAPGWRWAKSVRPLRVLLLNKGIALHWIVDGKEIGRMYGDYG